MPKASTAGRLRIPASDDGPVPAKSKRSTAAKTVCDALEQDLARRLPPSKPVSEWSIDEHGRLGTSLLRETLVHCMDTILQSNRKDVANALYKRMQKHGALPRRRSVGARGKTFGTSTTAFWEANTFHNWLLFKGVIPSPTDEQRIIAELCCLTGEKLAMRSSARGHFVPEPDVAALAAEPYSNVLEFLERLLDRFDVQDPVWQPAPNFLPWIGPSFEQSPRAAQPDVLRKMADDVCRSLRAVDGARIAILEGPSQSGKKTTLRFLLDQLPDRHLVLEDGCRLPILAISVDDHTGEGLVDAVFAFLSRARPSVFEAEEEPGRLDGAEKIRRIRRMASQTPACVIFGDVERVEENECVRGILGDLVGEIVVSLMQGHPLTRIILTSLDSARNAYASQASRLYGKTAKFCLPLKVSLKGVAGTPYDANCPAPGDLQVSGLAVRLSQACMTLMQGRVGTLSQRERLTRQCRIFLEADRPDRIVSLIHGRVLTPNERIVVGLVASSQDGLRISVLVEMVLAMSRLIPTWSGELPDERRATDLLVSLEALISVRSQSNDPSLVAFGAREREANYSLDEGWRKAFLATWWTEDRERPRMAQWLVAREAAAQARSIRTFDPANRVRGGFGRDLQTIKALVCSVDPAMAVDGKNAIEHAPALAEEDILPPLAIHVPVPDARSVLRFAFLQLYRKGLEGRDHRLLTAGNEAEIRLGVLLPFFSPATPWESLKGRVVERTLQSYGHLVAAFKPRERLEMLASLSMAALQVRDYLLLSSACRLGEIVSAAMDPADAPASYMPLMRLLRAETDAGIFLGGNPDDLLDRSDGSHDCGGFGRSAFGVQLSDVADRLIYVLSTSFPDEAEMTDDLLFARGKLFARLGEVRHLEGKLASAKKAFEEAIALERRASRGVSARTVVGGRGIRSCMRLLLGISRMRRGSCLWRQFIFGDDLAFPVPIRVKDNDALIRDATKLHAANIRRCSTGRANDTVGVQIDEARLRAARHEYGLALGILKSTMERRFETLSSLELLLELHSVRTRFLIDAAMLCLNRNAENAVFHSDDAIEGIRGHLGADAGVSDIELTRSLLLAARDCLIVLDRLVIIENRVVHPYMIYARYLRGMICALDSRISEPRNIVGLLKLAEQHLDGAVRHMRETAYRMHIREAVLILRGVRLAKVFHDAKPSNAEPMLIHTTAPKREPRLDDG